MKVVVLALLIFVAVTYAQWTAYVPVPTKKTPGCSVSSTNYYELISLATDSKGRVWQMGGRTSAYCPGLSSFLRYFDRDNHNWTSAWREFDSPGPSLRSDVVTWIDKDDNIYIYGSMSAPCEFWKFSPESQTWINLSVGNGSLNFVEKGVEDATNYPGCRRGSGYWYTPDDNSLWIFSGYDFSYGPTGGPKLPDLWRFNITSQQWAFIAGLTDPITSDDPVFADAFEVTPFQRWAPLCAVDAQYNLWLYGGEFSDDLWMFNRSSGWQYISGDNKVSHRDNGCTAVPTTVTEGVFSSAHRPDCAAYSSMTYIGNNKLALWTSYTYTRDQLPRLWVYNIKTQEWAYYNNGNGSSVANVLYVPDNSTTPGFVQYTRTIATRSLWVVSDKSFGVYVMDFPQCDPRYSPCSEHATCQEDTTQLDPICTCNEGYEGDGVTCTVPVPPVSPPVTVPSSTNTPAVDVPVSSNTPAVNAPMFSNTPVTNAPVLNDTPVSSNTPAENAPMLSNTPKSKTSSDSVLSVASVTLVIAFALSL